MKRNVIFALMASAILLSSCTSKEQESIGIIGGADGPTSIIVAETINVHSETKDCSPIRMLKANGVLYYDTGVESNMELRCGTLDGNLTAISDPYAIPTEDNNANFETDENNFGYQLATKTTVEVPTDGKWIVFKKVPEYANGDFSYCMRLTGRMPNAAADSEFIILSKTKNITFDDVVSHLISSVSPAKLTDFKIIYTGVNDKLGLNVYAENVTPSGLTLVFDQLGGAFEGQLQTGEMYNIEMLTDGQWKPVPTAVEDVAWIMPAYMIGRNDITTFDINWEFLYGKLSAGTYRISKQVDVFRGTGDFDTEVYSAEFTINE